MIHVTDFHPGDKAWGGFVIVVVRKQNKGQMNIKIKKERRVLDSLNITQIHEEKIFSLSYCGTKGVHEYHLFPF